jgi:hypothetical protein
MLGPNCPIFMTNYDYNTPIIIVCQMSKKLTIVDDCQEATLGNVGEIRAIDSLTE